MIGARAGIDAFAEEIELRLLCHTRGAHHIPAGIILAEIAAVIGFHGLQRCMRRVEGHIEKPGLLRGTRLLEKGQRMIHIGHRGVKSLVRHGPRLAIEAEGFVPKIIIGCAGKMAKVPLKSKVGRLLIQMPFARHGREIASTAEHFRNDRGTAQLLITRLTAPASGEQAHARRVALGCVIKLGEPQAAGSKLVEIRRGNLGAITSKIRIAQVICQNDENVRLARRNGSSSGMQSQLQCSGENQGCQFHRHRERTHATNLLPSFRSRIADAAASQLIPPSRAAASFRRSRRPAAFSARERCPAS